MEHTDDPKVALEITMDHLEELPDYYDHLDKMEKEAGVEEVGNNEINPDEIDMTNPDKDMGSPAEFAEMIPDEVPEELKGHLETLQGSDEELENTLLGFDSNTPNKMKDFVSYWLSYP